MNGFNKLPSIHVALPSPPGECLSPTQQDSPGGALVQYDPQLHSYSLTSRGAVVVSVLRQLLQCMHVDATLAGLGQKGGTATQHPAMVVPSLPEAESVCSAALAALWGSLTADSWSSVAEVAETMLHLQSGSTGTGAPHSLARATDTLLGQFRRLAALQDVPVVILGKLPISQVSRFSPLEAKGLVAATAKLEECLKAATAEVGQCLGSLCNASNFIVSSVGETVDSSSWLKAFGGYWRLVRCLEVVGGSALAFKSDPGHDEVSHPSLPSACNLLEGYAATMAEWIARGAAAEAGSGELQSACATELRSLASALCPPPDTSSAERRHAGAPFLRPSPFNNKTTSGNNSAGAAAPLTSPLLGGRTVGWREPPTISPEAVQAELLEEALSAVNTGTELELAVWFVYSTLLSQLIEKLAACGTLPSAASLCPAEEAAACARKRLAPRCCRAPPEPPSPPPLALLTHPPLTRSSQRAV
mmetsp:Transcript_15801/g.44209  ORF Transcript_15801/g.44209 Transcript_15801/m.44209 type:complete len:474 (+) Transcript_15801:141-1562(+)